ncbi:MAG: helix-turn-helix transcriptional regulator [Epulopiscium sp.]|nr:helix-turn-helix transcriptional regulator [Candidatus Epulonipiscium sp.]
MEFGKQLQLLRKKFKMTLSDLSKASGVSPSFISALERGEKNPTLDTLLKLSKAFNLNVSELLGQNSATPITGHLKDLVDSAQNLKPDQVQKLIEFIDSLQSQD